MGLLECASGASLWRGYDYYEQKKVREYEFLEDTRIMGIVSGSQLYTTVVDIAHPRKSTCNCPHAEGRRIICKHMIATYFTAFPKEAAQYYAEVVAYQEEEERRQAEQENALRDYICGLSKEELQQKLLDLLQEGPEWLCERFMWEIPDSKDDSEEEWDEE